MKKIYGIVFLAAFILFGMHPAEAADMNDYCVTPPYIGSAISPNLLLMIDNSASMYDLEYTDTTNLYCANNATQTCTAGSTCGGTAYCLSSVTTSTTTASTPLPCSTDADCTVCPAGATCNMVSAGEGCQTSGANANQCKKSKVITTTVTYTPISCSNDSTCTSHTAGDICNNHCTVTHNCYDDTFNTASTYLGYFSIKDSSNNTVYYSYSGGKFSPAGMPATCTYSAGSPKYICVTTTGSGTSETITGFVASGNFLNWLTASKFDVEKQILTGGKYDTTNQLLLAETRGCSGRKFIKVDSGTKSSLTFAIRGGSLSGLDKITSPATEFGQTYIEVYKGAYAAGDCAAAMNDWMNVNTTNMGTVQTDTANCTGASGNANAPLVAYNQTVHDCFWYYNGHGLSNLQVIQKNCVSDWSLVSAMSITNPDAPDAICSSALSHPPSPIWPQLSTNTATGADGFDTGFLGLCFNSYTGLWDAAGGFDANCSYNEEVDFCASIGSQTAVTDPASSNVVPGTLSSIPGFVMESGLAPLTLIGTLTVKVALPTAPTGLIDKYKNLIRFGAMTFQTNGSASECNQRGHCSATVSTFCTADSMCPATQKCVFDVPCEKVCSVTKTRDCYSNTDCPSGESCTLLAKTDGGIMLSTSTDALAGYIGRGACSSSNAACTVDSECNTGAGEVCVPSVGNHSGGLIQAIDNVVAASWTPFSEGFYNAMGYFARSNDYTVTPPASRSDFLFTTPAGIPAAYDTSKNPSQKPCQKNNVLIITDGMSTADQNAQVDGPNGIAKAYAPLVSETVSGTTYSGVYGFDSGNSCPRYQGSRSLPDLTWIANHRNIKNLVQTDPAVKHCSNAVYTPCNQDADCGAGNTCTNTPTRSSEYISTYIVYNGTSISVEPGMCDPLTMMTAAAGNGGTSLYQASNVTQLQTTLANAFDQVAARAASGTAASVLASGEGSGANIIQAVFYPHKQFPNASGGYDEISWVGRLSNLWYYIDPYINTSSIREDDGTTTATNTNPGNGDKILHLKTDSTHRDYIISMYYDKNVGATKALRYQDPAGNGIVGTQMPTINFEDLNYLWEAGTQLWKRNLTTSPRTIYTNCSFDNTTCIASTGLASFSTANAGSLAPYLNTSSTTTASNLITWVTGSDVSGYRSRTVMLTNIDNTPRVWKLGDVINSTPRIMSWQSQNSSYSKVYNDGTYGDPVPYEAPANSQAFTTTTAYKNRGVVFAGGNDGMVHAFKLGIPEPSWSGQGTFDVSRLKNPDTGAPCSASDSTPCGSELWAFIPKNALPYLQYMADPAYCHVYSIDLSPVLIDASINGTADGTRDVNSWRTILIGGMRFGGACRDTSSTCTDCVKTPVPGVGYSSYFALDVTDPSNPKLLWEFSDPSLGFTTSGPAIVRLNGSTASDSNQAKNGSWFVVLGSGPTGPISTSDHQFLGRSDQTLKYFILNLRGPSTGTWTINTDYWVIDTTVPNAFSGSLMNTALDLDMDYQDEMLYTPYVKKDTIAGTWTDGGVGRLLTKKDPNPGNWAWSTLIDGIGPVTSATGKILDFVNSNNLWVYFATGRYYYVQNTASDDPAGQRMLFGVKDPCMTTTGYNTSCTTPRLFTDLRNVTNVSNVPTADTANSSSFYGWYLNLDPSGTYTYPPDSATNFMSERVITDPLASSTGVVYFTSYKPFTDMCLLGGKSFIWAVQYNTGGAPSNLQGMILLQVSTGAIQQQSLANAFTDAGGRKSAAMEGKPPEMQGLSLFNAPQAAKRVVHIRER